VGIVSDYREPFSQSRVVAVARGHFGNPEERDRLPLEAVTSNLKNVTEDTIMCVTMMSKG
jgi:hypothetical protein